MKRWNQKGMTLIEVIVVLLLSSVLMVIAGGLLLDSMGYFNKTAQSNYEKQAVDAISSYVREQLVYATEVQIATEKPDTSDDWHWLSVDKDYHLTRDNETVYNDGFYRGRRLNVLAKYYDNYRLDLSFAFTDEKDKQVYRTATTLELVNIKAKTEKGEVIQNSGIKGVEKKIGDHSSDSGIYKIYYKVSGTLSINNDVDPNHPDIDYNEPTDPDFAGTVYDELNCRDKEVTKPGEKGNNKGSWKENVEYKEGDFVEYNGVIYRATKNVSNGSQPSSNNGNEWKPINPPYWVMFSSYQEGDVVIYQKDGKYYQANKDINNSNVEPSSDNKKWKPLTEAEVQKIIEEHKKNPGYCMIQDSGDEDDTPENSCDVDAPKTVSTELCYKDENEVVSPNDPYNNKGKWLSNITSYNKGDFVWVQDSYSGPPTWYRAIMDFANSGNNYPANPNGGTVWKRMDDYWSLNSIYEKDDVLKVDYNGKTYYVKYMNTGNYGNPANNLDSPTLAGVEFVEWDKVNKKWNVVCSQRCKASYLDKQ